MAVSNYEAHRPREATITVSQGDTGQNQDYSGDYVCSGAADEVEINAALAAVNALGGGEVVLLEGTYTLAASIVFPGNNLTLRGMGRPTFIDGDGLLTGVHGITLTGRDDCTIKDLAIQTNDGGGLVCHCIFIEDGSDRFLVENVWVVDSESDGIHIEGTTINGGTVRGCHILDTDDYGIHVDMDAANYAYRFLITENDVTGGGNSNIAFSASGGNTYCEIVNNTFYTSGADGVHVVDFNNGVIEDNICYSNVGHGISMENTDYCSVANNICSLNDSGDTATYDGIYLDANCSDNIITENHLRGNHRYGISCAGLRNTINNNYALENDQHGIYIADSECMVNDNYSIDNGQDAGGTYHGIYLTADADTCTVENNFLSGGPSHDIQEDGVHLASGAVNCSILGNYCYYLQGDGVRLAGSNHYTTIEGNVCFYGYENGIAITDSTDCNVVGNYCMQNIHHGIYLDNADAANVNDNFLLGNDRLDAGSYDGVFSDADSAGCQINDNYCYTNHRHGIYVAGLENDLKGNYCMENDGHGILVAATADECNLSDNRCSDNSQDAAGTYHGICLAGGADRCTIKDNYLDGYGDSQEDGIHLEDGCVNAIISGNYCYDGMGDGIELVANNTGCVIEGNHCIENDDYGIVLTAATCAYNEINDNHCLTNGLHGISVAGPSEMINDNYCVDNGQTTPNTYHGIFLAADADKTLLNGNYCHGGPSADVQHDGIFLSAGCDECSIIGNYCTSGLGDGIHLVNCDYTLIKTNYCTDNAGYGVHIEAGLSNTCENNQLTGNTTGGILDVGTDTLLPWFWASVPNPDSRIGQHQGAQMPNGVSTVVGLEFQMPAAFQELVSTDVVVIQTADGASGNMVWTVATDFGHICTEAYDTNEDTAGATTSITQNQLECLDAILAFTAIAGNDLVGFEFTRVGADGSDTLAATCYLLGIRVRYV